MDLVVRGDNRTEAFVEFKYPREPTERNPPWTMIFGKVLGDLYRLAACRDPLAERVFVFVETARLHAYLASTAQRYGMDLHAATVSLLPDQAALLPPTAVREIGALAAQHVTARRIAVERVDASLCLTAYAVDALDGPTATAATGTVAAVDEPSPTRLSPTVRGARAEILNAAHAVMRRSGERSFTVAEVVDEMSRDGTRYAQATIRTMITGHLCRNAPDHAATTYDDLERIDRGRYRLLHDD